MRSRKIIFLGVLVFSLGFVWNLTAQTRATQPLVLIMLDLEKQMTEIHGGLWRDDFGRIERAATAIAEHARVPAEERESIQGILGEDFASFVQADHLTHATARDIAAAAEKKDRDAILEALERTQKSCVSCHVNYRDRLRERVRTAP
jgi:hypothetical protein